MANDRAMRIVIPYFKNAYIHKKKYLMKNNYKQYKFYTDMKVAFEWPQLLGN